MINIKIIMITFVAILSSAHASENYQDRLKVYLESKYEKYVKIAAQKLEVSPSYLESILKKENQNESIKFIGHPETKYGLCKVEGETTFMEVNSSVKCIDKNLNAKIVFI